MIRVSQILEHSYHSGRAIQAPTAGISLLPKGQGFQPTGGGIKKRTAMICREGFTLKRTLSLQNLLNGVLWHWFFIAFYNTYVENVLAWLKLKRHFLEIPNPDLEIHVRRSRWGTCIGFVRTTGSKQGRRLSSKTRTRGRPLPGHQYCDCGEIHFWGIY